jgi:RimJ/RimL family protein N-acetyltransferase
MEDNPHAMVGRTGPRGRRAHGSAPASKSSGQLAPAAGGLCTDRLSLEPLAFAHAAALAPDLADPRLYHFMKDVEPPSLRELEARLQASAAGSREEHRTHLQWAAWARDERRYVGLFEATVGEGGRADLAYLTFSSASRQGYALEACRRVLRHLFVDHAARVVRVITAVENVPARALAERLGFRLAQSPTPLIEEDLADGHVAYLLEGPAPGAGEPLG